MINFKPIIIPGNRRKDGTFTLYIAARKDGGVKRIPTSVVVYPSDLTRSGKLKSPDVLKKGADICEEFRSYLSDLTFFQLEAMSCDEVVEYIRVKDKSKRFALDFFDFAEDFITDNKTPMTQKSYSSAINAFRKYTGGKIDVNAITKDVLLGFRDYLEASGKNGGHNPRKAGGSAYYIKMLAHIFKQAKYRYNDEDAGLIRIPRSPFDAIDKRVPLSQGQKSLGVETMQRIIDAVAYTEIQRIALDAFVVSFVLCGANFADLYSANRFDGNVWIYNRRKTMGRRADCAEMRVLVPSELQPFLERLKGRGSKWLGKIAYGSNTKDFMAVRVNRALASWAKAEGIEPFTFYAARHSFATIARQAGVEKATIDDALCHVGDYRLADIYAEKSWELVYAAQRKVLSLFNWGQ